MGLRLVPGVVLEGVGVEGKSPSGWLRVPTIVAWGVAAVFEGRVL